MASNLISQTGVSIWLPSYWISQAGVEEPKLTFIPAWPHKHPIKKSRCKKRARAQTLDENVESDTESKLELLIEPRFRIGI